MPATGDILGTDDGGVSWWTSYAGPVAQGANGGMVQSIDFTNGDDGWALLQGRGLMATTDGGHTWSDPTEPAQGPITTVAFVGPEDGWALTQQGVLLASTNGGHQWTSVATPRPAVDLCAGHSGMVWLADADGDVFSPAGADSWRLSLPGSKVPDIHNSVGPNPPTPAPWLSCRGDTVWALYAYGEAAGSEPYVVERTSNRGTTWQAVLGADVRPEPGHTPKYASGTVVDIGSTGGPSGWLLTYCGPCTTGLAAVTTVTGSRFESSLVTGGSDTYEIPLDAWFTNRTDGWVVLKTSAPEGPDGSNEDLQVANTVDGGARWKAVDSELTP